MIADEINRAAPRTQSALLEAMQEHTVTTANMTRELPAPFFVLATQNPVEMYGTYPLPEAELDRFFLKLRFEFPPVAELNEMVGITTTPRARRAGRRGRAGRRREHAAADGRLARSVPAADHVIDYASRLVVSLHPETAGATEQVKRFVRLGPSPRGAQALALAGRVAALIDGRHNLSIDDIQRDRPARPAPPPRAHDRRRAPGDLPRRDRPRRDRGAAPRRRRSRRAAWPPPARRWSTPPRCASWNR